MTFIGCGTEGAVFCRQYPITESSCVDRDFWTKDRQALVADCFGLTDAAGQALPHRMSFNAYSHDSAEARERRPAGTGSRNRVFSGSLALAPVITFRR